MNIMKMPTMAVLMSNELCENNDDRLTTNDDDYYYY